MGDAPIEKKRFDNEAFFAALDATRVERGLLWKDVAKESGVSPSTLTRMSQGKRPDVDGLGALSAWADLDVSAYLGKSDSQESPATLAMISTHLRSDQNLSPESAEMLEKVIQASYEQLRER